MSFRHPRPNIFFFTVRACNKMQQNTCMKTTFNGNATKPLKTLV
jgi:hypothetical protein